MMKFVAVLLVAAVFAVSVVDARHHGLVKRDANCVVNVVGLVENLLDGVLVHVNKLKSGLLETLTKVVETAITAVKRVIAALNLDTTCVDNLFDQIRDLPAAVIKVGDECVTKAINQARIDLHAVLDPLKDNLQLLCYLQNCFGIGIVKCIAQLGGVVLGVPVTVIIILGRILPILIKLLAAVVACVNNITVEFNKQLDDLVAQVKACPVIGGCGGI